MIKSTRNQIGNAKNPYQGSFKKILTVCSAGLLRSATLQNYLIKNYDCNVRNCGTSESFALIPLSEALYEWADWIVFVNKENFREGFGKEVQAPDWQEKGKKVIVLDIPDNYGFNDPKLLNIVDNQWKYIQKQLVKYPDSEYIEYDSSNQVCCGDWDDEGKCKCQKDG